MTPAPLVTRQGRCEGLLQARTRHRPAQSGAQSILRGACARASGHLGRRVGSAAHSGCWRPLLMASSTSAGCAPPLLTPSEARRASSAGNAGCARRLRHSPPWYQSSTKAEAAPCRSAAASAASLMARAARSGAPARWSGPHPLSSPPSVETPCKCTNADIQIPLPPAVAIHIHAVRRRQRLLTLSTSARIKTFGRFAP